jgi:cytochrome c
MNRHRLIALAAVAVKAAVIAAVFMSQAAAQTPPQAEPPQVKRGRLLFLQCRACHELQPTGATLVGPQLGGLLGRKVASVPGFGYSAALSAQDFTWDRERLDQWLTSPGKMVPGNAMAFAGVAGDADRAALIAYLETSTAIKAAR